MVRPRRVGQKAAVVGILQKSPVEPWCTRVGVIETCFHAVDHDSPRASAEELECLLKAIDDGDQVLPKDGNNAAQPAVTQHHHEAMNDTTPATAQFLQQAQLAEIHFCKLSRCGVDSSNRAGGLTKTTVLARKPMQCGIRNGQPLASEQFMDF